MKVIESRISLFICACCILCSFSIVSCAQQQTDLHVVFCPPGSCSDMLSSSIISADRYVSCALYDISDPDVIQALQKTASKAEVKLVTDKDNFWKVSHLSFSRSGGSQMMHNKFCIIDNDTVATGSYNPTVSASLNDLVVIRDSNLAKVFLQEFEELYAGHYPGKSQSYQGKIVSAYFCPEDDCQHQLLLNIMKSEESITFMSFAFTDIQIALALAEAQDQGIQVRGIVDHSFSDTDAVKILTQADIPVMIYNRSTLHHKVFIFDDDIVATGSYNPSISGNSRNEENLVFIRSKSITSQYLMRFRDITNAILG